MSITPTRHPLMARETATFEVIVLLPVPPLNECTAMLTPILFLPRYFSFLREDAVANWSLMDRKKSEDWTLLTVCMTFSVSSATERRFRLGTSPRYESDQCAHWSKYCHDKRHIDIP